MNQVKSKSAHKRERDAKGIAMHVSVISIIVNVLLSVIKLLAGIIAHSGALISDAIHSASDVFSTFIVMIGVTLSARSSDEEHQYGHERMECVASIVLAIILAVTGVEIGMSGIQKILSESSDSLKIPGVFAMIAALISIAVKEWMFWYTRGAAKKINSGALMADAWHHRSDALSSVGSFIGVLLARMGYPVLDPIASVVICLFILKAAYDIFKDSIDKMVDKSCSKEQLEQMKELILEQDGVKRVDEIRSRLFGAKMYVDVEIAVDGTQSLEDAHQISENVHNRMEQKFGDIKHCMVHVNPYIEKES